MIESEQDKLNKALNQISHKIQFSTMTSVKYNSGQFRFNAYNGEKWSLTSKEFIILLGQRSEKSIDSRTPEQKDRSLEIITFLQKSLDVCIELLKEVKEITKGK